MSSCTFRRIAPADMAAIPALFAGVGETSRVSASEIAGCAEDPAVELVVGECGGEAAAFGRLSMVGSREGWLDFQKAACGARHAALAQGLLEYQTERARELELRVVRAGWQTANSTMQRAGARLGYHRVASFGRYSSDPLKAGAPVLSNLTESDYSAIQNRLGRSPVFRAGAGLVSLGGRWMELTGRLVRSLLGEGRVLGLRGDRGGLEGVAVVGVAGPSHGKVCLGYVDAEWQSLERFALSLRGLAVGGGGGRTKAYLVDDPTLRGAFQSAGFQDDCEGRELHVFERFL